MKIIGLTGGIGSGKSTVTEMFKNLGIPVYISDIEAKKIMKENKGIKDKIKELLGTESYVKEELNKTYIAGKVFKNKELLSKLNKIVHPIVDTHFQSWKDKQKGEFVIKEAAILFESGGNKQCDYTILVSAPEKLKIERVMKRDQTTREKVLARMENQWSDSKKIPLADFTIINIDIEDTEKQVLKVYKKIILDESCNINPSFC